MSREKYTKVSFFKDLGLDLKNIVTNNTCIHVLRYIFNVKCNLEIDVHF